MKPLGGQDRGDSSPRWKEAERAEGRRSPKAETGRTSISACNRTLASARHTDKLCYQSGPTSLFAPLCIYARNQQPILGQLPAAVISSTGHPPRTLPRHKCAPTKKTIRKSVSAGYRMVGVI